MFKIILVILSVSFLNVSYSEDKLNKTLEDKEKDFQKQLQNQITNNQKGMEEFFQSSDFKMLQNRMHKILDSFSAYDDLNIEDLLQQTLQGQRLGNSIFGMSPVKTLWRESPTEVIFIIKAKANQKEPFNITVEKGMVKVTGTTIIERKNAKGIVISKSQSSINLSQNIPASADVNTVRYDQNKEGNILVIFKKLSVSKPSSTKTPKKQDLRPLKPQQDDITI